MSKTADMLDRLKTQVLEKITEALEVDDDSCFAGRGEPHPCRREAGHSGDHVNDDGALKIIWYVGPEGGRDSAVREIYRIIGKLTADDINQVYIDRREELENYEPENSGAEPDQIAPGD